MSENERWTRSPHRAGSRRRNAAAGGEPLPLSLPEPLAAAAGQTDARDLVKRRPDPGTRGQSFRARAQPRAASLAAMSSVRS